jgi:hypothetical protein
MQGRDVHRNAGQNTIFKEQYFWAKAWFRMPSVSCGLAAASVTVSAGDASYRLVQHWQLPHIVGFQ